MTRRVTPPQWLRARFADLQLRAAQLLRWLRARAFNVDKAVALKAESEAWHKNDRPTFRAPAPAVVEQLLKRGAPTFVMSSRSARAGGRAARLLCALQAC
jgi:hypothetical protein